MMKDDGGSSYAPANSDGRRQEYRAQGSWTQDTTARDTEEASLLQIFDKRHRTPFQETGPTRLM